ncbi:hypothetical protein HO133_004138 [Letharia lupina]|uniref:Uncharacterized protein n=1 Tax=Letharia lupina TaxID=560253 RepID=A0A8H6CAF8_9LECA|nr:uncharacterized protein HO133_004138 [Letharia lupina]KAF6219669.1 hypothetical protein HO133_004138 [Letharia lupina]
MESTPQFPRLRSLKLQTVLFSDYSMLDALLEGDLRELEVDPGHDSLYSEFFEQRGTMPALTTLVWDGKIKADQSLSFLQANTQLSKLSFQWEAPGVFLETRLLPLLTKSFRHLTSLSLKWEGDSIPGSALEAISSLEILQQLHLSAGHQHGWRYSWFIDHALMRSRLKKLTSLRRMAFTRDIYDNEVEWSAPERYYEDRFHNDLDLDADEDEWETWHCESMLSEARNYAMEIPDLEWVYFGQLYMRVSRKDESQGGGAHAFALSKERDQWWTYLREMFGWKGI